MEDTNDSKMRAIQKAQDMNIKIVDSFSLTLTEYFENNGLPSENILVDVDERGTILSNLPRIIDKLEPKQKNKAVYLSKFIAASAVGLFDAALNYLWDEVISYLRTKIIRFDLDYFYDSVITDPEKRTHFKDEDQLKKISDDVLLKGCLNIGIITEIGHKHLDFIRDMRNYASAAHPNQTELNGYQLIDWLNTCIKEVLSKNQNEIILTTKKLLKNIREENLRIKDSQVIIDNIYKIPEKSVQTLLRSVFGLYCDSKTSLQIKRNIELLLPAIWDRSNFELRSEIGLKHGSFSINGHISKKKLAENFLELVDGQKYLTDDIRALEMDDLLDELDSTHYGRNNFYNEVYPAKRLSKHIPETGDIPDTIRDKYVKTLLICRLGNYYGVADSAVPYYDEMISLFKDKEIIAFFKCLEHSEIDNALSSTVRRERLKKIAEILVNNTSNHLLIDNLNYIINKFTSTTQIPLILKRVKRLF